MCSEPSEEDGTYGVSLVSVGPTPVGALFPALLRAGVVAEGPWSKPPPRPPAALGWSALLSWDPPRGAAAWAEGGAADFAASLEALHGLLARLSLSARRESESF